MVSSKKNSLKLIWGSLLVGSHASDRFICYVLTKLTSLLKLQPESEAFDCLWSETCLGWEHQNTFHIHGPAAPRGKAHCAICCLQHSRGTTVIFSNQKCWHGKGSGNIFSLLAELSSFFMKIHPFGFLPQSFGNHNWACLYLKTPVSAEEAYLSQHWAQRISLISCWASKKCCDEVLDIHSKDLTWKIPIFFYYE